jgi:hypothetical protein
MDTAPRLDLQHVLWFFGAITASLATVAVLDEIPESSSDVWLLLASLGFLGAYGVAALVFAWQGRATPTGLMATVSASMAPAVAYAFTRLVDAYPADADPLTDFSGAIFAIGVVTVLAAAVAFALTRFPFALALVVGAALVTVQLLVPALRSSGDAHATAGVVSGAIAVGAGLLLDLRRRRREAFWFYVGGYFGIGAALVYYVFSGSGTGGGSAAWVALLLVGGAVLLGAAFLTRSTWAAYGALGVYAALAHYLSAHEWMRYVLLAASLAVFALGLAAARRPRADRPTSS